MTQQQFDQQNTSASYKVVAFNSKYAKKILHTRKGSLGKSRILGLHKFLSADGITPFSKSFIDKSTLNAVEMNMASSIIFFVKVDSLRADEFIPLHTFLEANQELAAMW